MLLIFILDGFSLGLKNTLCSEETVLENYLGIDTSHSAKAEICRTAAQDLFDIEPYSTDVYVTKHNMPKGCYLDIQDTTTKVVKYNKHRTGSKNENAKPICIKGEKFFHYSYFHGKKFMTAYFYQTLHYASFDSL